MQAFKELLRTAVTDQVKELRLEVGLKPQKVDQDVTIPFGQTLVEQGWWESICKFLFPDEHEKMNRGENLLGVLTIGSVGKILIILEPVKKSLRLFFPPEGHDLCKEEWKNLQTPQVDEFELAAHGSSPNMFNRPEPKDSQTETEIYVPDPVVPITEPTVPFAEPEIDQVSKRTPFPPAPPIDMFGPPDEVLTAKDPEALPQETLPPEHLSPEPMPQESADDIDFAPTPPPLIGQPSPDPSVPIFSEAPAISQDAVAIADDQLTKTQIDFSNSEDGGSERRKIKDFLIDTLLRDMVSSGASDMHLSISQPVIFRIDGKISRMQTDPISAEIMEGLILPMMPERNCIEFAESSDTDFSYELEEVGRFRVNIFRSNKGVGGVIRHIPSKILTAEQLGLPMSILKFCKLSKGLVLVTGPTGSGKSTTLAAMIDDINKNRQEHIITIEDPIEFVHTPQNCHLTQREVHNHTDSFAKALRAALREDPDIILVGEMRDLETVQMALESAETGHLVFATLHTNTAVSTVDRIIDQFPADRQEQIRIMLAATLKGVITQTLCRKPEGGRIAAFEILSMSDAVMAMIREGKNHMIQSHMQTQKADGNMLLNEYLLKLVGSNRIDYQEAWNKAVDKKQFEDLAKRMKIAVPKSF